MIMKFFLIMSFVFFELLVEIWVQNMMGEVGEGGKEISCIVINYNNWIYFNIEWNGQIVVYVVFDGCVQMWFNLKYFIIMFIICENLVEIVISFVFF